jgi:aminopeptidase N
MISDSDGFNRWNAGQQLAISIIESQLAKWRECQEAELPLVLKDAFVGVLDRVLNDESFDKAMAAHLLVLPTTAYLIERATVADVDAIHGVRESLADQLADALESKFAAVFAANKEEAGTVFSASAEAMARRAIANLSLSYLVRTGKQTWLDACAAQFENATNMTDQAAALRNLMNSQVEAAAGLRAAALESFHAQWQHEALVVDQWFAIQATSTLPDALSRVETLMRHADFDIKNPNKVRSLIGAFCGQNHVGFHAVDGSGYRFLADRVIELDRLNPQIASRLLTPLTRFGKFDAIRRELMQRELARIKAVEGLSRDVFEVVAKSTV